MTDFRIRKLTNDDYSTVAELIRVSTNYWYETKGRPPIFSGDPAATELFCDVYEELDPGCCFVVENARNGMLAGSCFYHPRPTHISLDIMNVHPNYAGHGVARMLLQSIVDVAKTADLPLRLVSSAHNLDSFSLYTRAGFVPRMAFQDMYVAVPEDGLPFTHTDAAHVRAATIGDVSAMAELELEISGISRESDYRYFLKNAASIWHASVFENAEGGLDGFLVSVSHPGSNLLGPGIARHESQAATLILAELNQHRGQTPVCLIPVECADLVKQMYSWGARNCEIHFAQTLGEWKSPKGVVMPTFMPESG